MLTKEALGINESRTNDDNIVPKVGPYFHLTSKFRALSLFFIAEVQKGNGTFM